MSKLAVNGGIALRTESFPVWPQYNEKELKALESVLKSGVWGTLGPEVKKLEERFSSYQQTIFGIAVTNGTVALEVVLRALGIGNGDEVILPPYTFNATASSIITVGATPIFVDIEEDTYNINPDKIEQAITPRTRTIIPVHIGGRACDMDRIMDLSRKHNLYVIEDCAHAHGSEWKGKRVGSLGHAGSFSFQASKNLNAGEGGFITTNDTAIYDQCWSIHHCGRKMTGKWYEHVNIGTNARMTEWQAAILDVQMDRIDEQLNRRMENATYLTSRLKEIACVETLRPDERITRNAYHLFIFKYKSNKCNNLPREAFIKAMNAEGIPCSPGYACLYKQALLQSSDMKRLTGSNIAYSEMYLENAEKACYSEGIWLTQNMLLGGKKEMDDVVDAIIKICENVDELL